MKSQNRKLFNRIDIWIIAGLLIMSLRIYIWYAAIFQDNSGYAYAQIIINGEVVEAVDLSIDRIFSPEQLPNVSFEIRGGAIAFIKSDCPDQICVNNGFLSSSGQISVCLPNFVSLVIRTVGHDESIDIIAH